MTIPKAIELAEKARRFGIYMHRQLLSEKLRLQFYKKIIDETVQNKTVIDLGTGSGILAMLAAKAGAAHVYALEVNEFMYELAKKHVRQNKLQNQITVIHFKTGRATLKQIPKVDVIVQEIFGKDPLQENVAEALRQMKPFAHSRTVFLPESFTYAFRPIRPSAIIKLRYRFDGLRFEELESVAGLPLAPAVMNLEDPKYTGSLYEGPTLLLDTDLQLRLKNGGASKVILEKSDSIVKDWAYSFRLNSCNQELHANGLGKYVNPSKMWAPVFFKRLFNKKNESFITVGNINAHRTLAW